MNRARVITSVGPFLDAEQQRRARGTLTGTEIARRRIRVRALQGTGPGLCADRSSYVSASMGGGRHVPHEGLVSHDHGVVEFC